VKRFLLNIFLFLIILICGCACLLAFDFFVVGNQYNNNYEAALIDKVDRLESLGSPKIILVGNSNLAFGINSAMIEEEMGMDVVNTGLFLGLGNAFNENIAKLNIGEGDIVVVCHNYYYDDDEISDRTLAWVAIEKNLELWKILRPKDYVPMIEAYPEYSRKAFYRWITQTGNEHDVQLYQRDCFNEYGDFAYRFDSRQIDPDTYFSEVSVPVPMVNNLCTDRLNELNRFVTDRGASMVIAAYPIAYGEYSTFSESDFEAFRDRLQSSVDCEVISDYTDYFYSYDKFYDMLLHLKAESTDERTAQLIADLKAWQEDQA